MKKKKKVAQTFEIKNETRLTGQRLSGQLVINNKEETSVFLLVEHGLT